MVGIRATHGAFLALRSFLYNTGELLPTSLPNRVYKASENARLIAKHRQMAIVMIIVRSICTGKSEILGNAGRFLFSISSAKNVY